MDEQNQVIIIISDQILSKFSPETVQMDMSYNENLVFGSHGKSTNLPHPTFSLALNHIFDKINVTFR